GRGQSQSLRCGPSPPANSGDHTPGRSDRLGSSRARRRAVHTRRYGNRRSWLRSGSTDPIRGGAAQPESSTVSCMQRNAERGIAVVVALMTMMLMMALGAALVLITSSETIIAANFRAGHEAFYAADAVLERALADLRSISDWTSVIGGGTQSTFTDGSPAGTRTLVDGSTIDLTQLTNVAHCHEPPTCTNA